MDDMDMILRKMKAPALKQVIENYAKTASFKSKWQEIFGALATDLVFLWVREGTLAVGTHNPLWSTEIKYYQAQLLKKINQKVSSKTPITQIKVLFLSAPGDLSSAGD